MPAVENTAGPMEGKKAREHRGCFQQWEAEGTVQGTLNGIGLLRQLLWLRAVFSPSES